MWSNPAPKLKDNQQWCLHPISNMCAAQDSNGQPYTKASCEPTYVWNAQSNCCYTEVECDIMDGPPQCAAAGGRYDQSCENGSRSRNQMY
jgi:hypothetical protein